MDLEFPSFASSRPRHAVGKAQKFKLSSAAAVCCHYELVSTASIMPTIPLCYRLLDELDGIEHDTKRVRLQREIDKLTEDLLDTEFDPIYLQPRRRRMRRPGLRESHVKSGGMGSCWWMVQNSQSSSALGCTGMHGTTRTKMTLWTVRCVCALASQLRVCTHS